MGKKMRITLAALQNHKHIAGDIERGIKLFERGGVEFMEDASLGYIADVPEKGDHRRVKVTFTPDGLDIESFFCNKCVLRSKGAICRHVVAGILAIQGGVYETTHGFFDIRPIDAEIRPMVTAFLKDYWSGAFILIRGEAIDITSVDGFALVENGSLTGVVTYIVRGGACEVVSLNSMAERRGAGTALVDAVTSRARELGCTCLRLPTTNDNLNAIGFYQKRGFDLVGVNLGAIDREREQKPSIPIIGQNGIPMHHEIEFAMELEE